jgi:hypothetical protein
MSRRFVYRPCSAEVMTRIGQRVIAEVVKPRIARGVNVSDQPAKPLSKTGKRRNRYFYIKQAKGLQTIRDLMFSGRTIGSIRVVSAKPGVVRIGFDNTRAARIAAINQGRDAMFWFSPEDQVKIGQIVREELLKAGTALWVENNPFSGGGGDGRARDPVTGRFTSGKVA